MEVFCLCIFFFFWLSLLTFIIVFTNTWSARLLPSQVFVICSGLVFPMWVPSHCICLLLLSAFVACFFFLLGLFMIFACFYIFCFVAFWESFIIFGLSESFVNFASLLFLDLIFICFMVWLFLICLRFWWNYLK